MNSKEINNRIAYLEVVIFNLKVNVLINNLYKSNSGNYNLSGYEILNLINERNTLKKELSHLKRVQILREERKEKLRKIENA